MGSKKTIILCLIFMFSHILALRSQDIHEIVKQGDLQKLNDYISKDKSLLEARNSQNLTPLLDNNANCYILQNHGAVSLGTDMSTAVRNAALLEKAAEIYYRALATGLPISELPADTQTLLTALLAEARQKAE